MPVLLLPDNFTELKEDESRKKRSTVESECDAVAVFVSSDGTARAVVYLNLTSAVVPCTTIRFLPPRNISCNSGFAFYSDKDELISIKVSRC